MYKYLVSNTMDLLDKFFVGLPTTAHSGTPSYNIGLLMLFTELNSTTYRKGCVNQTRNSFKNVLLKIQLYLYR